MKKYIIFLITFICSLAIVSTISGQIIIRPTALNNPFFKFEQLFQVQLMNTTQNTVNGVVQIRLEDNASNTIFQINSLPIVLHEGQNIQGNQLSWEQGLELSNQQIIYLLL